MAGGARPSLERHRGLPWRVKSMLWQVLQAFERFEQQEEDARLDLTLPCRFAEEA